MFIWSDFVAEVKARVGIDSINPNPEIRDLISRSTLDGAVDLQRLVPSLRERHTTAYSPGAGVETLPGCEQFELPQGLESVDQFYYKETTTDGDPAHLLMYVPWVSFQNASQSLTWSSPRPGIDPFTVRGPFPSTLDQITLVWTGVKHAFEDGDSTPFDSLCARAVSYLVKSELFGSHKDKRLQSQLFENRWLDARRDILQSAR